MLQQSNYVWHPTYNVENYKAERKWAAIREADVHKHAIIICANTPKSFTRNQWRKHFSEQRKILAYQSRFNEWQSESRSKKDWFAKVSICPTCSREVSNRAYWGEGRKGSSHFKGTCKPEPFFLAKIPRQTWKAKLPYPMPAGGSVIKIDTLEELCKFWGINNVAGTIELPKPKRGKMKNAA